jgi:hypothetical protein
MSDVMKMTRLFYLATLAICLSLISACDGESSHNGPGGLTPEDASALDEAAIKLDDKALPPPPQLIQNQAKSTVKGKSE